jgi:hypothetical protein
LCAGGRRLLARFEPLAQVYCAAVDFGPLAYLFLLGDYRTGRQQGHHDDQLCCFHLLFSAFLRCAY